MAQITPPSLEISNENDKADESESKFEKIEKEYDNGYVADKSESDKMGQKDNVKIPSFMEDNAPIPDHVKNLKCEKIELPFDYCKHHGKWVVIIRNVLTPEECDELVKFSEEVGYEDALVNIGNGLQQKKDDFRNCKRMMIDNWSMVNCLWSRLNKFIPKYFNRHKKVSFNDQPNQIHH